MKNDLVKCKKCGWVSFEITEEAAKNERAKLIEHIKNACEEEREYWNRDGGVDPDYTKEYSCLVCGNGTDFEEFKPEEHPDFYGHTINPIYIRGKK